MAADLRFVVEPAQGQAHEGPPQRAGDGLAERGLPHPGRSGETEDRTLRVLAELAHRQVLEDAGLDLVQVEVVVVEDLLRLVDVDGGPLRHAPRELQHPVDVGARHRVLGGLRRHHAQPLVLLGRGLERLRRHPRLVDPLLQIGQLGVVIVAAQLLLNRLHLLAQVELPLRLLHLGLDLVLDAPPQGEDVQLAHHERGDPLEPLLRVLLLEERLLVRQFDVQVRAEEVDEATGILDVERHHLELVGERARRVHHLLEEFQCVAAERLRAAGLRLTGGQDLHTPLEKRLLLHRFQEPDAHHRLHQEPHAAVGEAKHLVDDRGGADPGEFRLGVGTHGEETDDLVAGEGFVHEIENVLLAHHQRKHRVGKGHDVLHRHQAQDLRDARDRSGLVQHVRRVFVHGPTPPRSGVPGPPTAVAPAAGSPAPRHGRSPKPPTARRPPGPGCCARTAPWRSPSCERSCGRAWTSSRRIPRTSTQQPRRRI